MVESENFTVCDNISDSHVIGTLSASVPEGQDLTYRLTEDAGGLFEIDGEGKISLASGKDLSFTNTNRHVITVEVSNTVSSDTSTADVTIDVGTVPLVAKANYVFTYGNDVSVMLNNLGQSVESFTHSSNFPMGLDFASQNGQLSIQGSPRAVTLGESNQQISAVPIDAVLYNSCGSNSFRAMITVNPIFASGDLSPNIVAETNAEASSNNSNYLGEMYSPTNMPFASGGTGTFEDPIIIGIGEYSTFTEPPIPMLSPSITNILGFAIDFNGTPLSTNGVDEGGFHIRFITDSLSEPIQIYIAKINDSIPVEDTVIFWGSHLTKPNRVVIFGGHAVNTINLLTGSPTTDSTIFVKYIVANDSIFTSLRDTGVGLFRIWVHHEFGE